MDPKGPSNFFKVYVVTVSRILIGIAVTSCFPTTRINSISEHQIVDTLHMIISQTQIRISVPDAT
jgi:hypothetical protein